MPNKVFVEMEREGKTARPLIVDLVRYGIAVMQRRDGGGGGAARHFHETERIVRIWTEWESETASQKPRYNTQRTIRPILAREK